MTTQAPAPYMGQQQLPSAPPSYDQSQYPPQQQQPPQYAQPQYAGGYPFAQPQQPQYAQQQQPQYAQGGGMPGATVIIVQNNATARCPEAEQVMTAGFCNCFDDCETCMCAWFCPGCAFGTWTERLHLGGCCTGCCIYWFLCIYGRCCLACYAGNFRSMLYRRLGLPDAGCCLNCMCHLFCGPCALAQEGRAAKILWLANGGDQKPQTAIAMR